MSAGQQHTTVRHVSAEEFDRIAAESQRLANGGAPLTRELEKANKMNRLSASLSLLAMQGWAEQLEAENNILRAALDKIASANYEPDDYADTIAQAALDATKSANLNFKDAP